MLKTCIVQTILTCGLVFLPITGCGEGFETIEGSPASLEDVEAMEVESSLEQRTAPSADGEEILATFHYRSEVWPGEIPRTSTGTIRPLLAKPLYTLTVHHTGAGTSMDRGDTIKELIALQNYAKGAGKPWEYNYVVDSAGEVWEYAGAYMAAHSSGENSTAIGVLLLGNFTVEYLTPEMINGFRWLRSYLTSTGQLSGTAKVVPHKDMPGAATACPGPNVMSQWSALVR